MAKRFKAKKAHAFEVSTYEGTKSGKTYLVFRTPGRTPTFHVFAEVEAKEAARASVDTQNRPVVDT